MRQTPFTRSAARSLFRPHRDRLVGLACAALLASLMFAPLALAQEATEEAPATEAAATPEAQPPVAQTQAESLPLGGSVEGELVARRPSALYEIRGVAGDIITITLVSETFDAYLRLGDSQGNVLLEADRGADGLNARIGPVVLPSDAPFLVSAESFGFAVEGAQGAELGAFVLSVEQYDFTPLEYGVPVEAEADPNRPIGVFAFSGSAGDVITLGLDSDDFDGTLSMSAANAIDFEPVRDDDSGSGTNPLIGPYVLPRTGAYVIGASAFDGQFEGEFTIAVERLEVTPLEENIAIEGTLDGDDRGALYSFDAEIGTVVTLIVEGEGELDTTMTVIGPDGAVVAFNDDAEGRNAGIGGLTIATAGTYQVLIESFNKGAEGAFTLTYTASQGASLVQ